ncbi:MAG TPA: hypothetical protein VFX29_00960 [Longimicrobiaceae bacterium]|nr:hypothetical protein [Longimicrobiaceae bacterium]
MGVSLVAIAAIVASLAVVRHRAADERRADAAPAPQRTPAASGLDLDGIRAAGL